MWTKLLLILSFLSTASLLPLRTRAEEDPSVTVKDGNLELAVDSGRAVRVISGAKTYDLVTVIEKLSSDVAAADHSTAIGKLTQRVADLEQRVSNLETGSPVARPAPGRSCTPANVGEIVYSEEQLSPVYCHNSRWTAFHVKPLGLSVDAPAPECAAIFQAGFAVEGRRLYYVDIDGTTVYGVCDDLGNTNKWLGGAGLTRAGAAQSCQFIVDEVYAGDASKLNASPLRWIRVSSGSASDDSSVRVKCQGGSVAVGDGSQRDFPLNACEDRNVFGLGAGFYWVKSGAVAETKFCDKEAGFGDGSTSAAAGHTCKSIMDDYKVVKSGPRWIDPDGSGDAFQVMCDMENLGGGWTLVSTIGPAAAKDGSDGKAFPVLGDRPDKLLDADWTLHASLDRARMNKVFHATARGGVGTITRIYSNLQATSSAPQTYFIKKKTPSTDWDFFHALRYVPAWGKNKDENGYIVSRGMQTNEGYIPASHQLAPQKGGGGMQHWEDHTVQGNDGVSYTVSRHGVTGDIYSGCEWLFNFYPGQGAGTTYLNCLFDGPPQSWARIYLK